MKPTLLFLMKEKKLTMIVLERANEQECEVDLGVFHEDLMLLILVIFFHNFLDEDLRGQDEENEPILEKISKSKLLYPSRKRSDEIIEKSSIVNVSLVNPVMENDEAQKLVTIVMEMEECESVYRQYSELWNKKENVISVMEQVKSS